MSRDYRIYLKDILSVIHKIEARLEGIDFEQFVENDLRVDAVLYNLLVIGEAAAHVPDDIQQKHSTLDWRRIAGLRDIIAHEYFGIKLETIWSIVQTCLPELGSEVAAMLEEES